MKKIFYLYVLFCQIPMVYCADYLCGARRYRKQNAGTQKSRLQFFQSGRRRFKGLR